jgi:hypothetical protein
MESPHHLSILNSRKPLIYICIFIAIGIFLTELIYSHNDAPFDYGELNPLEVNKDPKPKIIILGDCRALFGIAADSMNLFFKNYSVYNLSVEAASTHSELILARNILNCKYIIAGINPATTYPVQDDQKIQIKSKLKSHPLISNYIEIYRLLRKYLMKPHMTFDSFLKEILKRNLRITYGFLGISDLIISGKISYSFSPRGWVKYLIQGSDKTYGEALNYYTYKNYLLNNSDKNKIQFLNTQLDSDLHYFYLRKQQILLIRLPVSDKMLSLENKVFPSFDSFIDSLANKYNYQYLNNFDALKLQLSNTDGSHLTYPMAINFTKFISETMELPR